MAKEKETVVSELLYGLCTLYTKDKGKATNVFTLALHMLGSGLQPSVVLDECRLTERVQKKLVQQGQESDAVTFMELYHKLSSQNVLQYHCSLLSFLLSLMKGTHSNGYTRPPQVPSLLLDAPGLSSGVDPPSLSCAPPLRGINPAALLTPSFSSSRSDPVSSLSSGLGSSLATSSGGDIITIPENSVANSSKLLRSGVPFASTPAVSGPTAPPPPFIPRHTMGSSMGTWSEIHPPQSTSKEPLPPHRLPGADEEEVSEMKLLRDLIYVFQDIEGEYIHFNHKEDGFRIQPQIVVNPSMKELCHKLAELGWLHRKIRHFIDSRTRDRSQGLVVQSFCSALSQELTEYYRLIAVLDGQLKQQQQEVGVGMTLRRLLVWTHDPRERLQMLAVLVDGCKRLKGGGMVSTLYHYSQHGDPAVSALVKHLLMQVYLPLHRILHSWIFEGELADRSLEFFVACDDSSKAEKLWRSKYTIRQSMLPSFIPRSLAQKILTIGKSINFLRQICKDNTQLGGVALRTWYLNEQGQSSFDSMTGPALKAVVESTYHETSKYLLQVLHSKYNLMEHMKALRRYLLLGQGDFIRHLMDLLAPELSKPASSLYLHNLTGTLEAAIRATNAQYDQPEALERLDVRMLDLSPGDMGWDVFSLHYHVDGSIGTVFTGEAMLKYLRVFNFLWRGKRMEYCLAGMWRKQTTNYKILIKALPELGYVLHQSHLLVSAMVHFISQLQYYITFEVLECSWAGLLGQVEAAEDLDQVIEAHDQFLEKITRQCLLDPSSQSILTRLRAIYDLIIMFQQKQTLLFDTGLAEVDRRQALEEMRDQRALQGEWRVTDSLEEVERNKRKEFKKKADPFQSEIVLLHDSFKDMVGELMEKVKGHSEQSLQFLHFRLDFNQHYSTRMDSKYY